jgi:hypothetical protein
VKWTQFTVENAARTKTRADSTQVKAALVGTRLKRHGSAPTLELILSDINQTTAERTPHNRTDEAANLFGKDTSALARGMSLESILLLQAEQPGAEDRVQSATETRTSSEGEIASPTA